MLQLYFLKHENHCTLFLLKSQATLTFSDGSDKFHVSNNNPFRKTILLNLHEKERNGRNEKEALTCKASVCMWRILIWNEARCLIGGEEVPLGLIWQIEGTRTWKTCTGMRSLSKEMQSIEAKKCGPILGQSFDANGPAFGWSYFGEGGVECREKCRCLRCLLPPYRPLLGGFRFTWYQRVRVTRDKR